MSKKAETTEVVKQTETAVASYSGSSVDDWGGSEMSGRDIVIPKLLLMQSTSDMVADGKAKLGDIIDSLTGEILGGLDKPIQFIPFHMEKVWIISSKKPTDSRFNFEKYEPVTAQNQGYPFIEKIGDIEMKYEYTLQFYVLRPEDMSLPYVVSFKSTSSRAGKILSTQMFVRNKAAGLVPPAYTMGLGSHKDKNDQGTFAVMDVKAERKSTQEEIESAFNWFKIIKEGKTQVAPEQTTDNRTGFVDENVPF